MELADGGDMLDLLQALKHPLSEEKARTYYRQFGDALRYMHSVVSLSEWFPSLITTFPPPPGLRPP